MPGGFGTLDEYFESLTLIQTNKINQFPIIIFDTEFHKELLEHIQKMKTSGTIDEKDMNLFVVTDSIDEVISIQSNSIGRYNLKTEKSIKPFRWLLEKDF